MPGTYRLILDGAAMEDVLRGPGGLVFNDLTRRADRLILAATNQIMSRKHSFDDGEMRLEASLVKRFSTGATGLICMVVAGAGLNPSYAYWVHEGNGPQGGRIFPKTKKFLVFTGSGGQEVFVRSVRTSKPNRYLSDNLPLVAE